MLTQCLLHMRSMLHWSPHCLKGYEATAASPHNEQSETERIILGIARLCLFERNRGFERKRDGRG
jgi:hypothetical protein